MKHLLLACTAVLALAACTEKPQTANPRKSDARAWQGADAAYTTGSWKAGDKASWEEQMRTRAQNQNDYVKAR